MAECEETQVPEFDDLDMEDTSSGPGILHRASKASVEYAGSLLNNIVASSIATSFRIINPCGRNGAATNGRNDPATNDQNVTSTTNEPVDTVASCSNCSEMDEIDGEPNIDEAIATFLGRTGNLPSVSKKADANFNAARASSNRGISILPHCKQLNNWDCGIACVLMIQRWLKDLSQNDALLYDSLLLDDGTKYGESTALSNDEIADREWMVNALETSSIWTIDLVILLHNLFSKHSDTVPDSDRSTRASYLFCSQNLSVDESYLNFSYYKKSFQRDTSRVVNRFQLAEKLQLPTLSVPGGVRLDYVLNIVSRTNCVAIVLLDNYVLINPDRTHYNKIFDSISSQSDVKSRVIDEVISSEDDVKSTSTHDTNSFQPTESQHSYTGHYVIVCGISTDVMDVAEAERKIKHKHSGHQPKYSYCLVIKNPGNNNATDYITPCHFERAWRANGTDHDIIFVRKQ